MRAKFKVHAVTEDKASFVDPEDAAKSIEKPVFHLTLMPVGPDTKTGEFNSDNKKYWQATPSGMISLSVLNEEAVKDMKVGDEYYVSFQKAK